jgi:hypothetical protein
MLRVPDGVCRNASDMLASVRVASEPMVVVEWATLVYLKLLPIPPMVPLLGVQRENGSRAAVESHRRLQFEPPSTWKRTVTVSVAVEDAAKRSEGAVESKWVDGGGLTPSHMDLPRWTAGLKGRGWR